MNRAAMLAAAALLLSACGDGADDDAPEAGDPEAEPDVPDAIDDVEQPEWADPPAGEIGAPVALTPEVVEGDDAAVAVSGVTVHTTGARLHVAVRYDPDGELPVDDMGGPMDLPVDDGSVPDDPPDDVLRAAVTYPDGSTTDSTEEHGDRADPEAEVEGPVLLTDAGMGDTRAWDQDLWMWPLPEPGEADLEIVLDWPEQGIDTEAVQIDVDEIDAATDRVAVAYPDDER